MFIPIDCGIQSYSEKPDFEGWLLKLSCNWNICIIDSEVHKKMCKSGKTVRDGHLKKY